VKEYATHTNEKKKIEDEKRYRYDRMITIQYLDVKMYLIRCRDRVNSGKKGNLKFTRSAPARKRRYEKASSGSSGRTQNVTAKASKSLDDEDCFFNYN